jgi:hypothetical protein
MILKKPHEDLLAAIKRTGEEFSVSPLVNEANTALLFELVGVLAGEVERLERRHEHLQDKIDDRYPRRGE